MALDPNIALQVKPFQVESPVNMLTQAMQVQGLARQNDLAGAQAEQTKMGIARQNALMQHLSNPGNDITTDQGQATLLQRFPDLGPKIVESLQNISKTKAETAKNNAQASSASAEATSKSMDAYRGMLSMVKTPQDFSTWVDGMYANPATAKLASQFGTPDQVKARIPTDPAQFQQFLQQNAVGMDKFIANQTTVRGQDITRQNSVDTNATSRANNASTNATSRANNQATIAKDLQVAGIGADGLPNGSLDGMVDLIGTGKMAPPTGMALRNPRIVALMEQVAQKYPSFDATDFGARALAAKSFSTGKDGQMVQSANTALNHLETLRALAAAQNNGDVRTINDIKNRIAKEFGGTAPANLQAAVTMVGPEISKAVIGAGGGQGDRDKVDSALASLVKGSGAQAEGTIATMQDLFGGRMTEAQRTYERTTGRKDFGTTFLSPSAQKVLAARNGAAVDAAQAATNAKGWTLHQDAKGNKAYVSPDGKQFEEVK